MSRLWVKAGAKNAGAARVISTYATTAGSIGSISHGSTFSGLLARVETGHSRIGAAGNGRIDATPAVPVAACTAETKSPGAEGVAPELDARVLGGTRERGFGAPAP